MSIEERVLAILKKYQPENTTTELQLTDSLNTIGIDSLGMAEALFDIEDTFGIIIEEPKNINKQASPNLEDTQSLEDTKEEPVQFETIHDLIVIVTEYIQKKS